MHFCYNFNVKPGEEKFIPYHRAYRKLVYNKRFFPYLILLIFPFEVLILLFSNRIILKICELTKLTLSNYPNVLLVKSSNFLTDFYVLDLPGKYPSYLFSLVTFIVATIGIVLSKFIKSKPVKLWTIYALLLILVSSIFFMFFPSKFPYNIKTFSELYFNTEIGIWLFVPIIVAFSLEFAPSHFLIKFFIVFLVLIYSIVFGFFRYAFFLYVILNLSYLFLPLLYFVFGPILDFTYIVGFFSIFLGILSNKIQKDKRFWRWVY